MTQALNFINPLTAFQCQNSQRLQKSPGQTVSFVWILEASLREAGASYSYMRSVQEAEQDSFHKTSRFLYVLPRLALGSQLRENTFNFDQITESSSILHEPYWEEREEAKINGFE